MQALRKMSVGKGAPQVLLQRDELESLDGPPHGVGLRQKASAWLIAFHHPLHAFKVALDVREAPEEVRSNPAFHHARIP